MAKVTGIGGVVFTPGAALAAAPGVWCKHRTFEDGHSGLVAFEKA